MSREVNLVGPARRGRMALAAVVLLLAAAIPVVDAARDAGADTITATRLSTLESSASEISGLVASQRFDDVYWGLADSGQPNDLMAIRVVGDRIESVGGGNVRRITVNNASNTDWESVSVTDDGWLIIAETGNNSCRQSNGRLYAVREPNPWSTSSVSASHVWPIRFPDKSASCGGIDVEATFTVGNEIYLVTKASTTRIYRLGSRRDNQVNDLIPIMDVAGPAGAAAGRVTGADVSNDGRTGVLAGEGFEAWVHTTNTPGGSPDAIVKALFSRSPTRTVRYQSGDSATQMESVAIDPGEPRIVMFSEQRRLFTAPLSGGSGSDGGGSDGGGGGSDVVTDWGSSWRYWAWGDKGTSWSQRWFDHSTWRSGSGQLGFGEGDERTVMPARPMTTYFRKWVDIDDVGSVQGARISMVVDDGAAVFVNGIRVATYNLRAGASFSEAATYTVAGSNEGVTRVRDIPVSALREGSNLIAVEVHQARPD